MLAAIVVTITTLIALLAAQWLPFASLILFYMTAILLLAIRGGIASVLFCSILSFIALSHIVADSTDSFLVHDKEDFLAVCVFMLASFVAAFQSHKARAQFEINRLMAERNARLYDFSRYISSLITQEDLAWAACQYVSETFACRTVFLQAGDNQKLHLSSGVPAWQTLSSTELEAAEHCAKTQNVVGHGTRFFKECEWLFLPLAGAERVLAVLGVNAQASHTELWSNESQRRLIAMRDQTNVALDRIELARKMEKTQLAAETEKLRSALLSSVSHDLRTPLASVIGSATTLRDFYTLLDTSRRDELLDTVLQEANRLNRFVENLLDMTKIGYGGLRPNLNWVDVRELCGSAVSALQRTYPKQIIQIKIDIDSPFLYVDAVLMERILFNVLDNASKYSPPNESIILSVSRQAERFVINVQDRGLGIPLTEHERIFDMFSRVNRRDAGPAGTGLGLSICRGLLDALGGDIYVKPQNEAGTCIEIVLPITYCHLPIERE
ncbi:MAG: DUF4118 domain-containing protein [Gammaproteobacteria bacterium]|nr:DUF4118 domain-containing protein [Gammaproteobacteria bacterium]